MIILVARTTQTQKKSANASMCRMGFEPTIPMLQRVKALHAPNSVATVIHTKQLKKDIKCS
jgi:hypothetical protein